jgi:hypothetical protein
MRRTVRDAQNRCTRLVPCLHLPPSVGCGDGNFQSLPSIRSLSTTTFLQEILLFSSAFRASPMMSSLPLPLSAVLGRIGTFFLRSRSHLLGRAPYPPAFPEISIVPHEWPIGFVIEIYYNHEWHGKKSCDTCNMCDVLVRRRVEQYDLS